MIDEASVSCVSISGMSVAAISRDGLVAHIGRRLGSGSGGWLLTANVDYLQRFCSAPSIGRLLSRADLIVADGVPLLWAARLQGTPLPERIAGSDLVWLLAAEVARRGRALFLLGGAPGAAERAADRFRRSWPELRIAGIYSPTVSVAPTSDQLETIQRRLEEARPDLVYVALGAPKEERVISELRDRLPEVWWVGVGISLSFVAGDVARAPRWLQRAGLEWLHRLVQQPRHLARRYLLEDLPFALRVLGTSWLSRFRKEPRSP